MPAYTHNHQYHSGNLPGATRELLTGRCFFPQVDVIYSLPVTPLPPTPSPLFFHLTFLRHQQLLLLSSRFLTKLYKCRKNLFILWSHFTLLGKILDRKWSFITQITSSTVKENFALHGCFWTSTQTWEQHVNILSSLIIKYFSSPQVLLAVSVQQKDESSDQDDLCFTVVPLEQPFLVM